MKRTNDITPTLQRSKFIIQYSLFLFPYSTFNIQYSIFIIRYSLFKPFFNFHLTNELC